MKQIILFCFFTSFIFGQQTTINFDTFFYYKHQKDSVATNLIYLTSKKNPEFLAVIYDTSKDTVRLRVSKYDDLVSINDLNFNDFLKAETITLESKFQPSESIKDFKYKPKHYELKVLSRSPNIVFELIPTLSKRKIKKRHIKVTRITILSNSTHENNLLVSPSRKWIIQSLPKEFQGIAAKIEYLNPETREIEVNVDLIETIEISKIITIQFTGIKIGK
uniref:hypothetical protein n=1 Tax=Flavobacterium sp. TaxID=239 RepID=UPI00404A4F8D